MFLRNNYSTMFFLFLDWFSKGFVLEITFYEEHLFNWLALKLEMYWMVKISKLGHAQQQPQMYLPQNTATCSIQNLHLPTPPPLENQRLVWGYKILLRSITRMVHRCYFTHAYNSFVIPIWSVALWLFSCATEVNF